MIFLGPWTQLGNNLDLHLFLLMQHPLDDEYIFLNYFLYCSIPFTLFFH